MNGTTAPTPVSTPAQHKQRFETRNKQTCHLPIGLKIEAHQVQKNISTRKRGGGKERGGGVLDSSTLAPFNHFAAYHPEV